MLGSTTATNGTSTKANGHAANGHATKKGHAVINGHTKPLKHAPLPPPLDLIDLAAADRASDTDTPAPTLPAVADLVWSAFRDPQGAPTEPNASQLDPAESAGRRTLSSSPTCRFALPAFLHYDARGLQLFEQITHLAEYYLTESEASLLDSGGAARAIANALPEGALVLELGCGSMRKTAILLRALETAGRERGLIQSFQFYALDLDRGELARSLTALEQHPPRTAAGGWNHVTFHGLVGTYDAGLAWLKRQDTVSHKLVLWLGSSLGNLTRADASSMLAQIRACGTVENLSLVLGADGRNNPATVARAYNDPHGVSRAFALNLLDHIGTHLPAVLPRDAFEFSPVYNQDMGRHEVYLRANRELRVRSPDGVVDVTLTRGELVHVEYSYKWAMGDLFELVSRSQWQMAHVWTHEAQGPVKYRLLWLAPAALSLDAPTPPPTTTPLLPVIDEWARVWAAWDHVLHTVIDPAALNIAPIDVRHPLVFYVGHAPCFTDVQIATVLGEPTLGPNEFPRIFTRGIDPDLKDPDRCHDHSEVPDAWPEVARIAEYRDRARARVRAVLERAGKENMGKAERHALNLAFEHEIMHLETLMYMVAQLSPSYIHLPTSAVPLDRDPTPLAPASLLTLPAQTVTLGRPRDSPGFGWDNEFPEHQVAIGTCRIQARPVSVGEYAHFLAAQPAADQERLTPAAWRATSTGGWEVRSLIHGWVPTTTAVANHPVAVSCVLADAYASWYAHTQDCNARLPTEAEMQALHALPTSRDGTRHVAFAGLQWGTCAMADVETGKGNLWEWTSTAFKGFPGFEPDPMYPGYSADFVHGGHAVVAGASWATHRKIAERKEFRNWYQPGYPYAFIGFRMVLE
ncbi:hypothetical protein AMAG_09379 [Allomyces macrogynus ATCC 38327]|uniref:Uncharacterized protein n=1 Tax=Allomyces macrogynus (strain ATCC 38327) TaxID=578462 RepID=A0A0L0SPC2_ALLM3|nr:hypothetical protein AMAG_09379 [Allomyces macrogynus ATCC 38327]|eukprot:KNE64353.1 hypothetical protein AMAG_09379 [Allomyces macrogynus ATCC 38327]